MQSGKFVEDWNQCEVSVSGKGGSNTVVMVVGILGALIVVAAVAVGIVIFLRKRKREQQKGEDVVEKDAKVEMNKVEMNEVEKEKDEKVEPKETEKGSDESSWNWGTETMTDTATTGQMTTEMDQSTGLMGEDGEESEKPWSLLSHLPLTTDDSYRKAASSSSSSQSGINASDKVKPWYAQDRTC